MVHLFERKTMGLEQMAGTGSDRTPLVDLFREIARSGSSDLLRNTEVANSLAMRREGRSQRDGFFRALGPSPRPCR